jgi:flagellar basal-body rod protein FlgG
MSGAFEIAGVGLASQQRALDVIANNVANLNTPAFKRSNVRFSEVIARIDDPDNVRANLAPEPSLAGVSARSILSLDEQGELERTGRALDLAIDGEGFIELLGPRGQSLLWRGGTLSVQEDGLLATSEGFVLRAMIEPPADVAEIAIASNGDVTGRRAGDDAPIQLGHISLVRVANSDAIERMDGGLYRLNEDAEVVEALPGEGGAGTLVQGAIERSNVDLNDEMVRLMIVQRSYAANAQIVQAADQLMAIANSLRR